jgi:DNA polymerase-3 subunit beta
MEMQPGQLTLAATDRYRLAVATVPITHEGELVPTEYVVPAKMLNAAVKLMPPGDIVVAPFTPKDSKQVIGVTLWQKKQWVTIRTLDGEFPKGRSLIPDELGMSEMWVDRERLINAVENAMAASEKNSPIRLTPVDEVDSTENGDQEWLEVGSKSEDGSEFSVRIEATFTGFGSTPTEFGANGQYLLDGLVAIPDDLVKIKTIAGASTKPVLLEPIQFADVQYLLMPVRLAG